MDSLIQTIGTDPLHEAPPNIMVEGTSSFNRGTLRSQEPSFDLCYVLRTVQLDNNKATVASQANLQQNEKRS